MKSPYRIFLILISFFIVSCDSEDDNFLPNVIGIWNLTEISGGWLGNDTLVYPGETGDTITWKFLSNDSLIIKKNGMIDGLGSYYFENKESQTLNQPRTFLIFEESSSLIPYEYMILQLDQHSLKLAIDEENAVKLKLER